MDKQISAKVVADSTTDNGVRITTFELEYPRFIHSEIMTHRAFSRNAASSRAIPIAKVVGQVLEDPAMPTYWGTNQPGMQAGREHPIVPQCEFYWKQAAKRATECVESLHNLGLHKQIVNRVLEPFQRMKTIVTATEWNNFFYLRDHEDAQPEIRELAKAMKVAQEASTPIFLLPGEWHLPYVEYIDPDPVEGTPYSVGGKPVGLEDALKISASCCAQVSYRVLDDGLEKALKIYKTLIESKPQHCSPFEHQATPMADPFVSVNDRDFNNHDEGATHIDMNGDLWSGNFKGWIQHRQIIKDNVLEGQ